MKSITIQILNNILFRISITTQMKSLIWIIEFKPRWPIL